MAFVIGAGLLLVLVVAMLAGAVLRTPRAPRDEDLHGELEAELAGDVAAGVLPAEDLPAATGDIEADATQGRSAVLRPRGGPWAWILLALVVVAGGALYWHTGHWRAAIHGNRAAVMHRANGMLARLQTHLEANPDDEQGWVTLGRARAAMGDYETAASAYGHAVKLDGENSPELLARWGEAQVLSDPDHLTRQEHAIFAAVLKSDPDNVRALWYGGLLALDAGHRDLAVSRWQRLRGEKNIPAPMASFVASRLHALGAPATAAKPATAGRGPSITLTINAAPALAARIKQDETLFVYVRDPAGGPPLAAARVPASKFPLHLTLDGDSAMLAGHDLASMVGKKVEIGAFLSPDGKATYRSGAPAIRKSLELHPGGQVFALTLRLPADKG